MGRKPKDYSQYKIGHLQPLYIDDTKPRGKGHNIYWICQCDCGNLVSVNTCNLRSSIRENRNASCGKCHAQIKDLTGQKFGKLTVLGIDEDKPSTRENGWKVSWLCKCDCGNIISVYGTNLTRNHTTSCGCRSRSIGEENIEKLLKENGVPYSKEYSFDDLRDIKKLRFDFAIFDKKHTLIKLIEFDGRQHTNAYVPWNSEETLEKRQRRDKMKDDYCKKNGIELIRIPYTKRDNISLEMLGLQSKKEGEQK